MEEFEYDVPDYIKKLERPMILGLSTPINKMDNKETGVHVSYSNSNLGSFITYKNENKVGHIDRSKIDLLSQYLYAHMINGFELDYNKIANNTFIHKPERIGDTLLCVLNKRTLYVLAIFNQILFAINLDNDYVHLETYDFDESINLFFSSDYTDKEKYFYSTLEYIVNKMRSTYGLRSNIQFSQNKCELSFADPNFIFNQENPTYNVPMFFDIDLKKELKLDIEFYKELKYLKGHKKFLNILPSNEKITHILDNYSNAEQKFTQKLNDLKDKEYINNGVIKQHSGYIVSSTDTPNLFVFRDFDDSDSNMVAYGSKSYIKNQIDLAIGDDMLKFKDDSEELINSYVEFINSSGLVNDELLKDIYIDKLSALQRNLSDKLNAFDDRRDTVVI